ncbi:hypothetical protein AVEN_114440-1 [Araneus ventricosus]|uniref:Uncharacterized protein n=1 Tax=Araneus ventricosus TaxID=182803 RepID=A0A4Y2IHU6_ARAVE|nr:hypothetical protein AVEN_114440-1 [Araneus ventricosus]
MEEHRARNGILDLLDHLEQGLFADQKREADPGNQTETSKPAVRNPWATYHKWAANSVLVGRGRLVKSRSQRRFKSTHSFLAL